MSTIEEVLTEKELGLMNEVPFEGAGVIDVGSSYEGAIDALNKEMEVVSKDPGLPDAIKDNKIQAIMDRIREIEQLGL